MNAWRCPKAMAHGPCGGVRQGGGCEVDDHPCPFLHRADPAAPPVPTVTAQRLDLGHGAIVVDVRAPAAWRGDDRALWRRTAAAVSGCVALIGEHVDNPARHEDTGRLPPEDVVGILHDAGVRVIATVTGRDRDQAGARRMVERYRAAGATAVHCVTGDHPASLGMRRPVTFGTESMRMLAEPSAVGLPATVAESPSAPGDRPGRLAAKQRAGASACILNHAGDVDELVSFADRCRAVGADLPIIAPVPMVADERAALGLASFPGLRLPTGYLEEIIEAASPAERGLDLAAGLTAALMHSGRFAGVNLSGRASGTTPDERLEMTSRFVHAARAAVLDTRDS